MSRTPWIPATNARACRGGERRVGRVQLDGRQRDGLVTDCDLARVAVGVDDRHHAGVVLAGLVHLVDVGAQRGHLRGLRPAATSSSDFQSGRRWRRSGAASSRRSPSDASRPPSPDRRPPPRLPTGSGCSPRPASRSGEPATNRYDPSNSNAASATARIPATGAWNVCATTTSWPSRTPCTEASNPRSAGTSTVTKWVSRPRRSLRHNEPCPNNRIRVNGVCGDNATTSPLTCNVRSSTSAAAPKAKWNTRVSLGAHPGDQPAQRRTDPSPPPTSAPPTPPPPPPTPPSTTNADQPTTPSTQRSSLARRPPVVPHRPHPSLTGRLAPP